MDKAGQIVQYQSIQSDKLHIFEKKNMIFNTAISSTITQDIFFTTEMSVPNSCNTANMTDLYLYFKYFVNILRVIA